MDISVDTVTHHPQGRHLDTVAGQNGGQGAIMDTCGYVYPRMDDLLRRQNPSAAGGFEPDGLQGADLSGGDGLHPKPLESDVGTGLELERGLERVAANEAWLSEQSQLPVESWLLSQGGKQVSLENLRDTGFSPDFTHGGGDRSLVVVDSRSNQWEDLSRDLDDSTDLLVLDENRSGIDQLKEVLSQNSPDLRYTNISLVASSDGDNFIFGSQELALTDLSDQVSSVQHSNLLDYKTSFNLFTVSSRFDGAIATDVVAVAPSLEQYARELIEESINSGAFASAAGVAFSSSKHTLLVDLAKKFVDGTEAPDFSWASFEVASYRVNGAYLVGQNKILISEDLNSDNPLLQKVLLEEVGHWLDDSVGDDDSRGDEGDLFARSILSDSYETGPSANIHSNGYLSVDGHILAAEFNASAPTVLFSSSDTSVEADGISLQLQFSESLETFDDSGGAVRSQFTIKSDGNIITPTAISLGDGAGTDDLLTFSIPTDSKISQDSIVTISYTSDGVNALEDKFETPVLLADFT